MRRQVGDRVWIEGGHFFGARKPQWGTILDNQWLDFPCWLCDDDECGEWPDVRLEDGSMAYHVRECEMYDGPDWRMRT